MFYLFDQNNSGGTFDFNEEKGIVYWVARENRELRAMIKLCELRESVKSSSLMKGID